MKFLGGADIKFSPSSIFQHQQRKSKYMFWIQMASRSKRHLTHFVSWMCLASLAGCNPTPAWEATYPATGQVTFKGRPISDVELSFFPEDKSFPDSIRPRAKTKEDGTFAAWTHVEGDGVPVGSYKVTLIHNEVAVSKGTIVAKPNDLPAKYSARDTTDILVQIKEGKNEIPTIELK
jgi:hypothetical protein